MQRVICQVLAPGSQGSSSSCDDWQQFDQAPISQAQRLRMHGAVQAYAQVSAPGSEGSSSSSSCDDLQLS